MIKKNSVIALAVLILSTASTAQVKVVDQEYKPMVVGSDKAQYPQPPIELPQATGSDLPIDTAELMVARSKPFVLRKGVPIHSQLEAWARYAGWDLIWYPSVSWKAIGNADMNDHKDVSAAVEFVVNVLRDEGKPIRLRISEGNRIMEVVSNEVRSQE